MTERRTIPQSSWPEKVDASRSADRRYRQRPCLLVIGCASAAIGVPALLQPAPRLLWNASPSVPVGLYSVAPGHALRRGGLAVAWLPDSARRLAAARRYLPANVPLVKPVAALPPDRVCALARAISVNGVTIVKRLRHDRQGRELPWWSGCRTLKPGQVFLLAVDRTDSFDGRYFGPINTNAIVGSARLLWAR